MIDRDETSEPWLDSTAAEPRAVDAALAAYASARGWARRLEGARVHGLWADIAGPGLAAHTSPVRLHGGVLVINVNSSAWAAQIPYLSGQIISRANEVLGEGAVQKVVVAHRPNASRPRR